MSSFKLIEAEKTSFPIQFMCRMLGVSRSGYYDWRDRPPSRKSREDTALTEKVREIHERRPPDLQLSKGPRRVEGARDPLRP